MAVLDLQMVLAWLARFLKIKSVFKDQNILDKSLYFERCCPICYSPHSEYMYTWIYPTALIYVTCLTPYMSSIYSPCPMWIFWLGLCGCQEKRYTHLKLTECYMSIKLREKPTFARWSIMTCKNHQVLDKAGAPSAMSNGPLHFLSCR